MTAVDVDALDKLREAATPGPWENPYPFTKLIDAPGSTDNLAIVQCDEASDAALIVGAVNALPNLIAEARKLRALREAVEGLHVPEDVEGTTYCAYDGLVWPCMEHRTIAAVLSEDR